MKHRDSQGRSIYTLADWTADCSDALDSPSAITPHTAGWASGSRKRTCNVLQNTGLGGTPIDVENMAIEPWKKDIDYKSRPWEYDAFFCADLVDTYWEGGFGYIPSVDQCNRLYELSYKTSHGKF